MRLMSIQRQRDQERRRRQAQAPPRGKETTPHKLPLPPPSVTLWSSGGSSSSFLRLRWGKGTRWTCLRLFFLLRWVGVYLVFFTLVCVDYSNLYICSTSIYTNQKEKKTCFYWAQGRRSKVVYPIRHGWWPATTVLFLFSLTRLTRRRERDYTVTIRYPRVAAGILRTIFVRMVAWIAKTLNCIEVRQPLFVWIWSYGFVQHSNQLWNMRIYILVADNLDITVGNRKRKMFSNTVRTWLMMIIQNHIHRSPSWITGLAKKIHIQIWKKVHQINMAIKIQLPNKVHQLKISIKIKSFTHLNIILRLRINQLMVLFPAFFNCLKRRKGSDNETTAT